MRLVVDDAETVGDDDGGLIRGGPIVRRVRIVAQERRRNRPFLSATPVTAADDEQPPPPILKATMKATILLGTLKSRRLSNTETLCEFLRGRMARRGIECEIVKLVEHDILPGTYSDMGSGDGWPAILDKVLASDILVLATPIWWDSHSSLIQRVIERLDELHDRILAGETSALDGKLGGIVITGDSDGAQHIIGHLCNFCNAIGLLIPPYATLSVLWERLAKDQEPTREELLQRYESQYTSQADTMISQLLKFAPG